MSEEKTIWDIIKEMAIGHDFIQKDDRQQQHVIYLMSRKNSARCYPLQ